MKKKFNYSKFLTIKPVKIRVQKLQKILVFHIYKLYKHYYCSKVFTIKPVKIRVQRLHFRLLNIILLLFFDLQTVR